MLFSFSCYLCVIRFNYTIFLYILSSYFCGRAGFCITEITVSLTFVECVLRPLIFSLPPITTALAAGIVSINLEIFCFGFVVTTLFSLNWLRIEFVVHSRMPSRSLRPMSRRRHIFSMFRTWRIDLRCYCVRTLTASLVSDKSRTYRNCRYRHCII